MRIAFYGLEKSIELTPGRVSVLQVENQALFTRLCSSLRSGEGEGSLEPYSLWNEDVEVKPGDAFLFVDSPFDLPWDDRALAGEMSKRFEKLFLEDEELRGRVDRAAQQMAADIASLGLSMHAGYGFGIEWDVRKFIRAFGFGVDRSQQNTILDSLIDFMSLALDAGLKKPLVFVNLKTFLTESELKSLYEHAFFTSLSVLLLENKVDENVYEHEDKRAIDLQFLEY